MGTITRALLVGVGATAVMDLGGELVRRTTGVAPLDYGLVGRWIGHMPDGRFAHASIAAAAPVRRERELGTVAHYAIGVSFAGLLLAARPSWGERPTLGPALVTGIGSTIAPWVVMQPAFGLGIAGSRTPDPTVTRLRSLRAHAFYGLGLHLSARAVAHLLHPR